MASNELTIQFRILTNEDCRSAALLLAQKWDFQHLQPKGAKVWGVPRGGIPASYLVYSALDARGLRPTWADRPEDATLIVDDIIDSGQTRDFFLKQFPKAQFEALFTHEKGDPFLIFPWEKPAEDSIERLATRLSQVLRADMKTERLHMTIKATAENGTVKTLQVDLDGKVY